MTEIAIVLTLASMSAICLYAVSLIRNQEIPLMRTAEKTVLYFFSLLLLPVLAVVLQILVDNNVNFNGMSGMASTLTIVTVIIIFIIMFVYFRLLLFKTKDNMKNGR